MSRQETVLTDDARRQRQLGDTVRNDVEVRYMLCVLGEDLEEAGVVYAMIIVMSCMYVQACLVIARQPMLSTYVRRLPTAA